METSLEFQILDVGGADVLDEVGPELQRVSFPWTVATFALGPRITEIPADSVIPPRDVVSPLDVADFV